MVAYIKISVDSLIHFPECWAMMSRLIVNSQNERDI